MTIRRSLSLKCMVAQCDECFDLVEFEDLTTFGDVEEFMEAKARIDGDGWFTKRTPQGRWVNLCPDCV